MTSITSTPCGQNRPVLLLGGAGRLGAMLSRFWPVRGDLLVQSRTPGRGDLCLDPLRDTAALEEAMRGVRAVVCLAGVTPAHAARTGDAMDLNTALALAAIAAAPPDVRVFVASSAAVYGASGGPCAETDVCAPVTDYGRAKLAMEKAALKRDHPVTVLRIGNVAGADAILGGWHAGMQIDLLPGGGTPRRSYIGPRTLARTIHRLSTFDDLPGILNIAAPGTVAMGDLLDAAGLPWAPRPPAEGVIAMVGLDTSRLAGLIRFAPKDGTAAGLVAEWQSMDNPT